MGFLSYTRLYKKSQKHQRRSRYIKLLYKTLSVDFVEYAARVVVYLTSKHAQFTTFRVSCRQRDVYIGHARLSDCPRPYAHTTARTRM